MRHIYNRGTPQLHACSALPAMLLHARACSAPIQCPAKRWGSAGCLLPCNWRYQRLMSRPNSRVSVQSPAT